MIEVNCESYVLCNRTDEELASLNRCHGMYTCNLVSSDNFYAASAIAEAVKYGEWQILGDEIYCPYCAVVVARNSLEMAKEAK